MSRRKTNSVILFCILLSFYDEASASFWCSRIFSQEYKLYSVIKNNFFAKSRSLLEYAQLLHLDFMSSLARLKESQIWMDLGGGQGQAALDYLKSESQSVKSSQVLVVSYKTRRFFKWPNFNGKLKVLEGRFWEEIPDAEIPQMKLVTDVLGVLSYTPDLSRSLQKVFDHLEVGGELYTYNFDLRTRIEMKGELISLKAFLKTIPGLQAEGQFDQLKITKTSEKISVPSLELIKVDEHQKPPLRHFRVKPI